MNWLHTRNNNCAIPLASIPDLTYAQFSTDVTAMLCCDTVHCVAYFATPSSAGFRCYCLLADDATGDVMVASYTYDYYQSERLESLTAALPCLNIFEREMHELHGIEFSHSPWDKPLCYPFNRHDQSATVNTYPFYKTNSDTLHQVQVGPVHAGIIEPGAFRFHCDGEKIIHLEIALGYQHRGIEHLICHTDNRLCQISLAESIAGDSVVAHTTAMAMILENGNHPGGTSLERAIALEMERIAIHIGDTAALCADMAYQTGHVACEALRTLVINAMQDWCGNRFGHGLIRPHGSDFELRADDIKRIATTLDDVLNRYNSVGHNLMSTPSVLARLENTCVVTRSAALRIGAVGPAARSAGLGRDARRKHHFVDIEWNSDIKPPAASGDLMARLQLRLFEVNESRRIITKLSDRILSDLDIQNTSPRPKYSGAMDAESLYFSLVEGWRGEICHAAITDANGGFAHYKIIDPSRHNWMMLALSVRGAQISDFPLSNKSFNLSYAGHDL